MKKKCLIASTRYPYSYKGGDTIRTQNLIEYMQNCNYDIDLLTFIDEKENKERINPQKLTNIFIIETFNNPFKYLCMFKSFLRGIPLQCSYYINNLTRRKLKKINYSNYDVVLISLTRISEIANYIKGNTTIIYDMVDILTVNYEKAWKAEGLNLKWKFIYFLEYPIIKRLEKKILQSSNIKFLVSKRDLEFALKNLNAKKSTLFNIPNYVDEFSIEEITKKIKEKILNRNKRKIYKVCFVGNMLAQHNYSAITKMFINNFNLRLQLLNCELYIVGRMTKKQSEIYIKNGFRTIMNPINLYKEIEKFDFGISVLTHCSGLQNKLYDYALMGLPIIASYDSADGIGFVPNKHYLVANSNEEILSCLNILINNGDLSFKIAKNALKLIEKNYSKKNILNNLRQLLNI